MRSADYQMMISDQRGQCAICGFIPPAGERLCIDHDHQSGEIRGLLCDSCNLLLGHAKDDLAILRKAMEYLEVGGHHSRFRVEGGRLISLDDSGTDPDSD